MKRSAFFLFMLVASFVSAQTVTFTGTKFQDANGNTGTLNGTISFQPTNQFGQPINGKVGGGGQMSYVPVTCAISHGAVATGCKLVDTALTAPANIGYTIIWKPAATLVGSKLSQPSALGSYTNVQPQANNSWCTSGTCNFDNFVPNSTNLPLGYSVSDLAVGNLIVDHCQGAGCSTGSGMTWPGGVVSGIVNYQYPNSWGSVYNTTNLIPFNFLNGVQASLGFTPENVAHKGAASGYAPLDINALLPAGNLPEGDLGKIPIGQGPGIPAVFADPLVQGTQVDGSATEANPVLGGIWDGAHHRAMYGDSSGRLWVNIFNSVAVTGTFWQSIQPVSGTFYQATQPVSGTFYQATQPISSLQLPTALDGSGFLKTHEQGIVGVTGTFWQATQPISSIQLPSALDGSGFLKVSIQNATLAITGTFWQSVQPVSGTFWQTKQPISQADGDNVTLGTKADAADTHTDTTAISIVSILKAISAKAQSPAALPANQSVNQAQIGGTSIVADPCQTSAKTFISISLTANTQLISGTSAKKIYICSIHLIAAASTNVAIVEGTGTVCATGIAGVGGMGGSTAATGWNFAANGGIVLGNGGYAIGAEGTNADNLCLLVSAANQISGGLSYVAY
jgi:hypothetical protein